MVEKPKDPTGGGAEELAAKIRVSASEIWLAGLGAFARAQEEGGKIFEVLVKKGGAVQERTRKVAGDTLAEITAQASGTWDKTWDRLEQVFEDRVVRALQHLNLPSKEDVDALSRRVAELAAIVEKTSPRTGKGARAAKMATDGADQAKKSKAPPSR